MRKTWIYAFIVLFLVLQAIEGITPQKWELQRLEQFLKGKFDGISVSYEGALSLAPREEIIAGPSEEFYLSLLKSPDGVIYVGTGHSGKIYRIGRDGNVEPFYQAPEMDIYCLAQDDRGNVYAASSPNGKIYKITPQGEGSTFFDPPERYIWDLDFLSNNTLLAAVGETGGIYTITNQGEGKLLLKAKENHILCMELAANGDIYAGSGGKGRFYRLSGSQVHVLFESPFDEIKSIALDGNGDFYVAAGGLVTRPAIKKPPVKPVQTDAEVSITVTPQGTVPQGLIPDGRTQPSALFKVDEEGVARQIWSSNEDLIYTLYLDTQSEKIVFGTGNRGRIFTVDEDEKVSLLLQKSSEQVYSIQAEDSRIYTISNNPPQLSILHTDQRLKGEYSSQVLDANLLSSWGRVQWDAELPSGTSIQIQTRSGNSNLPSQTWSNWSPPYQNSEGEQILNPKGRYLQFKILFRTDSGRASPVVKKISLFYLQTNVAPQIPLLEILPVNVVFMEPPIQNEKIWGLNPDITEKANQQFSSTAMAMAKKTERKGYQTIVWDSTDDNRDGLIYTIYIKSSAEKQWRLLQDKWIQKIFAFDTLTFPDGEYAIKLEADDSPSNPANNILKTDKISRSFVIDNSLPVFRSVEANRSGGRLTLKFSVADSYSRIKEVKYLVRPDEWRSVFPVDGICDSQVENFDISIPLPERSDTMITIKAVDEHGNVGVRRTSF